MQTAFEKNFIASIRALELTGIPGSAVTAMMVHCRKLLESEDIKQIYPTANLFSNWIVHVSLNRSASAFEILENINDFLDNLLSGKGGGPFGPEITRRFKLGDLRKDLIDLCNRVLLQKNVI